MAVSRIETTLVLGLLGISVAGALTGAWYFSQRPSSATTIQMPPPPAGPPNLAITEAIATAKAEPQPFVASAYNASEWRPDVLPVNWPDYEKQTNDKPLAAKTSKAKIEAANALLKRWAAYKSSTSKDLPTDDQALETVRYLFSIDRNDPGFPEAWATFIQVRQAAQQIASEQAFIAQKKQAEEYKRLAKTRGVNVGMTKEEVLGSNWGKPTSVNTTITGYGRHEQWVYHGTNYLYFDNDKLTSIQTGR